MGEARDLKFTGGEAGAQRTLSIRFAERAHGDAYAFDGAGGSLAHTFYPAPPNTEAIAGDMHFDSAENWQIGTNLDLYSVALHEAGHALGLGHSDLPGTVMYPYYHQASGLTADDIAGFRTCMARARRQLLLLRRLLVRRILRLRRPCATAPDGATRSAAAHHSAATHDIGG